jgi:MEMO1 family protein
MDRSSLDPDAPAAGRVRPPMVAGSFYPGPSAELGGLVDELLAADTAPPAGRPLGLIVPHAGYVYSGGVAGAAFARLAGSDTRRVVVIAPSHFESFDHAAVYGGDYYETPLGRIRVDQELIRRLLRHFPSIRESERGHRPLPGGRGEHALEVQLPFLQRVLGDFTLVPIVMGRQDFPICRDLARALTRESDSTTLVVASSDLSHYYPDSEARLKDGLVIDAVRRWDYFGLRHYHEGGRCEACGIGPILTAMIYAGLAEGNHVEVVRYATSGDVPPFRREGVVGYLAALFSKTETDRVPARTHAPEARRILEIARNSVAAAAAGEPYEPEPREGLDEVAAVFVTLRRNGDLRGCVGTVVAGSPLRQAVAAAAGSAATGDLRFEPVAPEEVGELSIEVSRNSVDHATRLKPGSIRFPC